MYRWERAGSIPVLATIKLNNMTEQLYEYAYDKAMQVGKLQGAIGALIKYNNPEMSNTDFKILAKTYIECSTDEQDIAMVMEQANKRGVDLT